MNKLSLIFGIHCHQPVGNFEEVISRAVDECYWPFLKAAADAPRFKFFAHFSGALLRKIETTRPAFLETLKLLVSRSQMELLGGGMYEPILSALPEAERTGQIRRMSDYLQNLTGRRPKGLWLAERAWDPQLCKPLSENGISHVFLDDFHFEDVEPTGTHGYYLIEEAGYRISVFPIREELRYLIPYKSPSDVLSHLKTTAEKFPGEVVTYADDGEKFGLWPGTRKWVEDGSTERFKEFFNALVKAEFLDLATPSEWMANHAPGGPVYLPGCSYQEMAEWTLPHRLQEEYVKFKSEIDRHAHADLRRRLLRGGFWKGFLVKYPESNWMHKRVCSAIMKIGPVLEKLGADREARTMRDLLDRASCNDAFWHGVFGGLYLPHLRRAVYENLLSAENRFSKKMGLSPTVFTEDIDADGQPEIMAYTPAWVIGFKPALGAGIVEWSFRPATYNFQNTLTRRPESYHTDLRKKSKPADGTEEHLDTHLIYDRYQKMSGLLHALAPQVTLAHFKKQSLPEITRADGTYEWNVKDTESTFGIRFRRDAREIFFEKDVVIFKHESKLSIQAAMEPKVHGADAVLGLGLELFYASVKELSIRIGTWTPADAKASGGPVAARRGAGPDRHPGLETDVTAREMEIVDRMSGTRWLAMTDRDVRFFLVPSYTVSQTESGYEKTFQGLSILLVGAGSGNGRQNLTLLVEIQKV